MRALILEDNRDRRVAMIGRLVERFPFLHVAFFDASPEMIGFMESDPLQDVVMISLDHDLEMISGSNGDWIDPGTGLEVAKWLSKRPNPICPVVVHTTNSSAGDKMIRVLEKSHWNAHRVVPHDDLRWIDGDWFSVARNAIVDFAPQRRSTHAAFKSSTFGESVIEGLTQLAETLESGGPNSDQSACSGMTLDLDRTPLDSESVKRIRGILGVSQAVFASFLGVSVRAVQSWEQGKKTPSELASRFMDEIRHNPDYWMGRFKSLIRSRPA